MGKKTNWSTTEDQTLCRVWLTASDLQLQGGDHKASNFWNMVRELFHQEMETAVERPLNGLKVRWTRINRDSQKFAAIFSEIQSKGLKQAEENGGESGDAAAVALLTEQQWIDEAKDAFHRYYNTKFSFEGCWKQLRYSTKWLQLFADSRSNPVVIVNSMPTSTVVTEEVNVAQTPSSTASEEEENTTTDNDALEASAQVPSQQLQGLTATLIEELKRQNDLLEDQNAIALLKVNGEAVPEEARDCYELLRTRYLKKARTNDTYSSNGRTSTLV
ncbi:Glutathione S-transferase T3 [Phytophthora nicotianae]|uniref:Glutathione S-transferase T3 n=1 Tax=Phytophthora nicotianae TaxID=4792 RepID=A0A0W8C7A1_PHYNI|nr:Glutathione S-transferase T3 [Phytophthora nicotianae]